MKQTNEKPKRNFIKIECSKQDLNDQKKSKKYTLNLPKKYQNIESDSIIGLYITQLDECFNIKLSINQVYFKDIERFFDNLIPDLG